VNEHRDRSGERELRNSACGPPKRIGERPGLQWEWRRVEVPGPEVQEFREQIGRPTRGGNRPRVWSSVRPGSPHAELLRVGRNREVRGDRESNRHAENGGSGILEPPNAPRERESGPGEAPERLATRDSCGSGRLEKRDESIQRHSHLDDPEGCIPRFPGCRRARHSAPRTLRPHGGAESRTCEHVGLDTMKSRPRSRSPSIPATVPGPGANPR